MVRITTHTHTPTTQTACCVQRFYSLLRLSGNVLIYCTFFHFSHARSKFFASVLLWIDVSLCWLFVLRFLPILCIEKRSEEIERTQRCQQLQWSAFLVRLLLRELRLTSHFGKTFNLMQFSCKSFAYGQHDIQVNEQRIRVMWSIIIVQNELTKSTTKRNGILSILFRVCLLSCDLEKNAILIFFFFLRSFGKQ